MMIGKPLGVHFENVLSIHFPDYIQVSGELIDNRRQRNQFRSSAEAQEPAEELVAYIDGGGHHEMTIIIVFVDYARSAETLYNSVKKEADKAHLHTLSITKKHGERTPMCVVRSFSIHEKDIMAKGVRLVFADKIIWNRR